MTAAEKFLQEVANNAEIRGFIESHSLEEGMDKTDGLLAVAKEFGFDVAREDLEKTISDRMAAIEKAKGEAEAVELSVESLAGVSGGFSYDFCKATYETGDNCWTTDNCCEIVDCYWGALIR